MVAVVDKDMCLNSNNIQIGGEERVIAGGGGLTKGYELVVVGIRNRVPATDIFDGDGAGGGLPSWWRGMLDSEVQGEAWSA